ncbi:hypothetical protein [Planctomicrobium sp. SH527]|uniref:hypothetical protein n=1 Tax=Planctomicrobium sp. SH527 TaxID=3448123 RepID=UPI003F5C9828
MKTISRVALGCALLMFSIAITGCGAAQSTEPTGGNNGRQTTKSEADERQDALAKLDVEDRAHAVAQGYCAVSEEPLGSMGVPIKVVINDQSVFVCCKGCEKKAKADAELTLSKVNELKERVKIELNK